MTKIDNIVALKKAIDEKEAKLREFQGAYNYISGTSPALDDMYIRAIEELKVEIRKAKIELIQKLGTKLK